MLLSVETPLEIDFESLKEVWSVEMGFEVRFEGLNEKVHVHAILGLGKKNPAQSRVGKFFIIDCSASP